MEYKDIELIREERIAFIYLNRPEVLNALKVNSYTAKYGSRSLSSANDHKIHPARKSRKEG